MTRTNHQDPNYQNGDFDLSYHLEMISDTERVSKSKAAIDSCVFPEAVFCELGCGTGIFSIYAAKKCKKVYAIEYDKKMIEIAKRNAKKNNVLDKIEFILIDATNLELPEKVDIVYCEMMSIWLIAEPQVIVMNNILRFLNKNAVVIPNKVINLIEVANTDYVHHGIEIKTSIAEFSGIKSARVATESKVVNTINLKETNPVDIKTTIKLEAVISGILNCVRLSSIVQFAKDINFYSTDTLMPISTVPLQEDVEIEEGECFLLHIEYGHKSSLNQARFSIEKQ